VLVHCSPSIGREKELGTGRLLLPQMQAGQQSGRRKALPTFSYTTLPEKATMAELVFKSLNMYVYAMLNT
jgi:hypothetical protein